MLGKVPKKEALKQGFSHYGSYYGIPIYLGELDSDAPIVGTQYPWMEPLMTIAHYIEGIVQSFSPIILEDLEEEPGFVFLIKGELNQND